MLRGLVLRTVGDHSSLNLPSPAYHPLNTKPDFLEFRGSCRKTGVSIKGPRRTMPTCLSTLVIRVPHHTAPHPAAPYRTPPRPTAPYPTRNPESGIRTRLQERRGFLAAVATALVAAPAAEDAFAEGKMPMAGDLARLSDREGRSSRQNRARGGGGLEDVFS